MMRAEDCFSFSWPAMPTSGRMRWREYRLISAGERTSFRFAARRSMSEKEPPAMLGTIEIVSPALSDVPSCAK